MLARKIMSSARELAVQKSKTEVHHAARPASQSATRSNGRPAPPGRIVGRRRPQTGRTQGSGELADLTDRFGIESYHPGTRWRFAGAHLHPQWEWAFPADGVLSWQRFCAL